MFVHQAHAFTRQARFVLKLAAIAGYTNILTVLMCGTVTSHVSGTISNLGHDLAKGEWMMALFAFAVVFAFFTGASLTGLLEELGRRSQWRARYALPLAVEMLLMLALLVAFELHAQAPFEPGNLFTYVACVAAFALGVQNATITRISGGVIRTTHVTGVTTDLGLEFSLLIAKVWDHWLSTPRQQSDKTRMLNVHSPRRFLLLAAILGSFAEGSMLGTLAYIHAGRHAMLLPVVVLIITIIRDFQKPFAGTG